MPVCCLRNLCNFASLNQCLIKKNKRYEHYSLFVIRCCGWLMSLLHIQKAGLLWELIVAVIGAIVLLFVISLFKKK